MRMPPFCRGSSPKAVPRLPLCPTRRSYSQLSSPVAHLSQGDRHGTYME